MFTRSKGSTLHTKTFTNFDFLLSSNRFIRVQEKKIKSKKQMSLEPLSYRSPKMSLQKKELEQSFLEENSPRHMVQRLEKGYENKTKISSMKKEPSNHPKFSKIELNPSASIYGLSGKKTSLANFKFLQKAQKSKSVMMPDGLHINLSNLYISKKKSPQKSHINVDSIVDFQRNENSDISSNENSPLNNNAKNNENNVLNMKKEIEIDEENSVIIDQSWREIKKEMSKKIIFTKNKDREKETHGEILKILRQINHSDIFHFEGVLNKNVRNINQVKPNRCSMNRTGAKTINEIIGPSKRLLKDPINYNLIESRANRFNIKNKRITLQGLITKTEWERDNFEVLPNITQKSVGKNFDSTASKFSKKEFYSKWYLPVDYWKIEKPNKKKDLLDTPLKNGSIFLLIHLKFCNT